jgi:pimeloyl-ACP methyl ester carboxylesterase
MFNSARILSLLLLSLLIAFAPLSLRAQSDLSQEGIPFANRHFIDRQIRVPMDWNDPSQGPTLEIAYRVFDPDSNKPFLFVVGGGPAHPSIDSYWVMAGFRQELNAYAKYYRLVFFDQRGTGQSTALSQQAEKMNAQAILDLFSAPAHARDLGALIRKVRKPGTPFYIAGHSYGGVVVNQYMQLPEIPARPTGVFLFSIAPIFSETQQFFNSRMEAQIAANERWIGSSDELKQQVEEARKKILVASREDPTLDAYSLDNLFSELTPRGIGQIQKVVKEILGMKKITGEALKYKTHALADFSEPLLNILDWNFHNTVSTVSQQILIDRLPLELKQRIKPWMLLETRVLMNDRRVKKLPEEKIRLFGTSL